MNPELKKHYSKIWQLIKEEEASLPARLAGTWRNRPLGAWKVRSIEDGADVISHAGAHL
jgi:hypothetical protein